jgi:hypothetical protein
VPSRSKWTVDRPHTLVIACSDGRLQDQTDEFLHGELGLAGFDRFYVPGGGGALASSGPDFFRAVQMRTECAYLIKLHEVSRVILLFHGPATNGPSDACCADYRRKLPTSTPQHLAERQRLDALELVKIRHEWAAKADVSAFRCEVDDKHHVSFVDLDLTG